MTRKLTLKERKAISPQKIGDEIFVALWLDGTETDVELQARRGQVINGIKATEYDYNMTHGAITIEEWKIGDPGVPEVPDHIQGPNVRLLVAKSRITGYVPTGGFLAELEPTDLDKLIKITKREYEAANPGRVMSERDCLMTIDRLGPEVALDTLRSG